MFPLSKFIFEMSNCAVMWIKCSYWPGDCDVDDMTMKASDNPAFTGCSADPITSSVRGICSAENRISKLANYDEISRSRDEKSVSHLCSWKRFFLSYKEQPETWSLQLTLCLEVEPSPTGPRTPLLQTKSYFQTSGWYLGANMWDDVIPLSRYWTVESLE